MGVKIPAQAEMNVIRPKMQLSGGFAPVSLEKKGDLHFRDQYIVALTLQTLIVDSRSQLPVIWDHM